MKHQLFHVVLLLFICSIAVISAVAGRAYACDYDEIKKNNGDPVVVVREVPKNGQDLSQAYTVVKPEKENWEPLRIRVSTKDVIKGKYCEELNDRHMDFVDGEDVPCSGRSDSMTEEKKNTMINKILPEAIKLHTDRLRVQRMSTRLQVPDFGNNSICSRFTVPSGHHAPGVPDADFVLYVAAGPGKIGSPLTWAVTCAIDEITRRPIVGAMNINPENAYLTRPDVRFVAHVLAHALGFDYENMKERKMTKEVPKGKGKERTVVSSATVLEKAKEHYGCDDPKEVQLEYAGEGQPTSHWDRCNAKDELMSVHASGGRVKSMGYYTALTIAAFEDLGFFKGNFNMSESMSWGHNQNCEFLNTFCKTRDELKPADRSPSVTVESCTSDRQGRGSYYQLKESTPNYRFLGPDMEYTCDPEEPITLSLGLYGKDSWCLDADSIKTKRYTMNTVCAAVNCDNDGFVKIQLKENGTWHDCKENESFKPTTSQYPMYERGTIKCPKYSEVCTIRTNGSSRLRLQEEEQITLVIPEITASSTTENQVTNVPSSSGSHAGQNSQTSTVNNAQGAPSTGTATGGNREGGSTTPTPGETTNNAKTPVERGSTTPIPGETTNNAKTRENSVDSNIVNGKEKTPISKTPNDKEILKEINIQNNTTESILNISFAGKDNSQVTKVYPPFLLLVLVILNLLVSF